MPGITIRLSLLPLLVAWRVGCMVSSKYSDCINHFYSENNEIQSCRKNSTFLLYEIKYEVNFIC